MAVAFYHNKRQDRRDKQQARRDNKAFIVRAVAFLRAEELRAFEEERRVSLEKSHQRYVEETLKRAREKAKKRESFFTSDRKMVIICDEDRYFMSSKYTKITEVPIEEIVLSVGYKSVGDFWTDHNTSKTTYVKDSYMYSMLDKVDALVETMTKDYYDSAYKYYLSL